MPSGFQDQDGKSVRYVHYVLYTDKAIVLGIGSGRQLTASITTVYEA